MRRLLCAAAKSALLPSALFLSALFVSFFTADRANAAIVVRINRSTQTMQVVVDGVPRYDWRVRPAAAPCRRRAASIIRNGSRRAGSRANTIIRRCRTRSSSAAALPFTAPTRPRGSAVRCRMAACGCSPRTPLRCLAWSSGKAWARRRSWCIEISPSSSQCATAGRASKDVARAPEQHPSRLASLAPQDEVRRVIHSAAIVLAFATTSDGVA